MNELQYNALKNALYNFFYFGLNLTTYFIQKVVNLEIYLKSSLFGIQLKTLLPSGV